MMYIFFDVDGVLNSSSTLKEGNLHDKYIDNLAKLVKNTKAKTVLISTWRFSIHKTIFGKLKPYNNSTANLIKKLKKRKIKIDYLLEEGDNCERAEQIKEFIEKKNVKDFVIIDDEGFNYKEKGLDKNLIQTKFSNVDNKDKEGFCKEKLLEAINIAKTIRSDVKCI